MALYYFHLRNGRDVVLDPVGKELPGIAAVRSEAVREARAIVAADAIEGKIDLGLRIEVQDAKGAVVLKLPFKDAVTIARLA